MYTPHTVTVYNVSEADDYTVVRNITILKGVFLSLSKADNIRKSGLESADSATLYIPFNVLAVDGVTREKKTYLPAKQYDRQTEKSGYWTLDTGGESSAVNCFFVKGKVVLDKSYNEIRNMVDFVFDVTSVDTKDFGTSDMQHWQVGGR